MAPSRRFLPSRLDLALPLLVTVSTAWRIGIHRLGELPELSFGFDLACLVSLRCPGGRELGLCWNLGISVLHYQYDAFFNEAFVGVGQCLLVHSLVVAQVTLVVERFAKLQSVSRILEAGNPLESKSKQ